MTCAPSARSTTRYTKTFTLKLRGNGFPHRGRKGGIGRATLDVAQRSLDDFRAPRFGEWRFVVGGVFVVRQTAAANAFGEGRHNGLPILAGRGVDLASAVEKRRFGAGNVGLRHRKGATGGATKSHEESPKVPLRG